MDHAIPVIARVHVTHAPKKEKVCSKGYGSVSDYKKKDDCNKCDENCCAHTSGACLDVQKNVLAVSRCTRRFNFSHESVMVFVSNESFSTEVDLGFDVEFDVITAIFEIVLTTKSRDTIKNLQIQDSLAGIKELLGRDGGLNPFGRDVNIKAKSQSCDDYLIVQKPSDIRKSNGNLLDSCKSYIPPCTSCRSLVEFTFSIFNADFELELSTEMSEFPPFTSESFKLELERSCILSKVTNSLTVTGQIEEKCANGYGNDCSCDSCKKVKCTDICPIVVQAERILDDDMELTSTVINVVDVVDEPQIPA